MTTPPFAITIGAGKRCPQGQRRELPSGNPVDALAAVLRDLPVGKEAWWSPHAWRNDRRAKRDWVGTIAAVIDIDYQDTAGKHAPMPADSEAPLLDALLKAGANLAHMTPRGARAAFVYESPVAENTFVITNVKPDGRASFELASFATVLATAEQAMRAARCLVDQALDDAGLAAAEALPGVAVDAEASKDLARIFWSPRAIVDGIGRNAEVRVLRPAPYGAAELAAIAPSATAPRRERTRSNNRRDHGIAAVLSRLQGVKKTDNGWDALCPAHDDHEPSLSVAIGDDNRILVKCHRGCEFDKVTAAMRLPASALAPEGGRLRGQKSEAKPADGRPSILVDGGRLHHEVEEAEIIVGKQALAHPNDGIYSRGNLLVRPIRFSDQVGSTRKRPHEPGTMVLSPVDVDYLRARLCRLAMWYTLTQGRNGQDIQRPIDPPIPVVRALLANAPWRHIPALTGIVTAPTMRPDGTLIQTEGYDEPSRLLVDFDHTAFPLIPEHPTRAEAEAALSLLLEPLRAFPFADEASRSVALSAIITAVVRRSLRTAPLHAYTAPKMASGKTLLATVASYVAIGRSPSLLSQTDDDESERKRMLAALVEAPLLIVLDNIERPLKSAALCTCLTEPNYTDRLLGVSRTVTVQTNTLFCATGNNLLIEGDLTSRSILCSLDPECERPEEREFDVNLHEWVPNHRPELVAAVLTIVRAYLAAGSPKVGLPNFARFEQWSTWVRSPLVWLGQADPCATRAAIESGDPVREGLRGLLQAWRKRFGFTRVLAQEVAEAAQDDPSLKQALLAIAASPDGRISTRRLGKFLSKHARRIEDGLRFERASATNAGVRWVVHEVGLRHAR